MTRLFELISQYRVLITFVLLELFCAWLVISKNAYIGTKYFSFASSLSGATYSQTRRLTEYLDLKEVNASLASENARLRSTLEKIIYHAPQRDSLFWLIKSGLTYTEAKVIHNTTLNYKNFITINKGIEDGIEPGMAVIGMNGAVGKVKYVSENFSMVMSLLNIDQQVSCMIKRTGEIGTVRWDGADPLQASLMYISRHTQPAVGDTIITSGYNAVFPSHVPVGIIDDVRLREEFLFYDIKISLVEDFGSIAFVEVVQSMHRTEIDSLQQSINPKP